jgi:hypothetical protein
LHANSVCVLLPPTPRFISPPHLDYNQSEGLLIFSITRHCAPQMRCDVARCRDLGGRIAVVVRAIAIAKTEGAVLDRDVVAPIWQPQQTMCMPPPNTCSKEKPQQKPADALPLAPPTSVHTTQRDADEDPVAISFDSLGDVASSSPTCSTKIFADGILTSSVQGKTQQQPLALLQEHAKKKRLGSVYVRTITAETVCSDPCPYESSVYTPSSCSSSLPPPKFSVVIGSKTYVPPHGQVVLQWL